MWTTATDLLRWADQRESQAELPLLVRKLVLASAKTFGHIRFPWGDSVFLPGWDGRLFVEEATWPVPDGLSVWEMGTNKDVVAKASEDVQKRSDDPLGVEKSDATFVFVTPRRWPKTHDRAEFEDSAAKSGGWKRVTVIDADDLENWLNECPAVALWYAKRIGRKPENVESLEDFWIRASSDTDPDMSADLALAGRNQIVEGLAGFLEGDDTILGIRADTRDEGALVVAAAAKKAGDKVESLLFSCAVVVHTIEAWREITASRRPLILIPLLETDAALGVGEVTAAGHRVIAPTDWSSKPSEGNIVVPWLDRDGVKDALMQGGMSQDEANDHARNCGRSLQVLIRRLSRIPEIRSPAWASEQQLVPALLVGRWRSLDGDRAVLAQLASVDHYDEFDSEITQWLDSADAPIRRYGETTLLTSPFDAWVQLSGLVPQTTWERYIEVLGTVLSKRDPALDLPADKRWAAVIFGKERSESDELRSGLAQQLTRLVAFEDRSDVQLSPEPSQIAESVVQTCLSDPTDIDQWASLAGVLPYLAEAAPDALLACLEALVASDATSKLFESSRSIFVDSPHTSVMWAVEKIRWFPHLVARCADVLILLSDVDPGGNSLPSPDSVFRETFLPFDPQNSLPFEEQYEILRRLASKHGNKAWPALCSLLDDRSFMTVKEPLEFRKIEISRDRPKTWADVHSRLERNLELLSEFANDNLTRWLDLLEHVEGLHECGRVLLLTRVIDHIERADDPRTTHVDLYQALSKTLRRSQHFQEADWALSGESLELLKTAVARTKPHNRIEVYKWLFAESFPDSLFLEDEASLDRARVEALDHVVAQQGIVGIEKLGETTRWPGYVGRTAARLDMNPLVESALFDRLISSEAAVAQAIARCFVQEKYHQAHDKDAYVSATTSDLNPEEFGLFAQGLPNEPPTWDMVDSRGTDARGVFWKGASYYVGDETLNVERAASELIEFDCIYNATLTLGLHKGDLSSDLVVTVLKQTPVLFRDLDPLASNNLSYDVVRLFERLDDSDIEIQELVQLEFEFFPVVEHTGRGCKATRRLLSESPAFFVELLSIFHGKAEIDFDELEPGHKEALGHQLYSIFNEFDSIPGLEEEGDDPRVWISDVLGASDALELKPHAEEKIGTGLARVSAQEEGAWPPALVCDLFEEYWTKDLETGFVNAAFTKLGARFVGEGQPDQELSQRYAAWSDERRSSHPRLSSALRRLSKDFEQSAKSIRNRAEIRRQSE